MNNILDTAPTTSIDRTIWTKFNQYTYITPEEVLAAHGNDISTVMFTHLMNDDIADLVQASTREHQHHEQNNPDQRHIHTPMVRQFSLPSKTPRWHARSAVRWIQLPMKIERHKHAHPYAGAVLSGS